MSQEEVLQTAHRFLANVRKSSNDNIIATCPFHTIGERITTTLTMSLSRGVWFCFSCHEKGNLQTFLRKVGVGRNEIDQKYHFLIEELDRSRPAPPDPLRTNVLSNDPLPEGVLGIFDFCPMLLLDAGFTEETLRSFEIGFDEKHMRITFPLRDLHGRLVGISGRTIYDDVQPRYKIYDREFKEFGLPAREAPERAGLLWNAHNVYPEIFFNRQPEVILVEGFKACMWAVQSGLKNTVGLIGSYLTYEHQWILERMGATVYVFLDNNLAGWRGREYIGKTLSKSLEVKIVEYPDDREQPDELGQEEVLQAFTTAQNYNLWSMTRKEGNRWPPLEKIEKY